MDDSKSRILMKIKKSPSNPAYNVEAPWPVQ